MCYTSEIFEIFEKLEMSEILEISGTCAISEKVEIFGRLNDLTGRLTDRVVT